MKMHELYKNLGIYDEESRRKYYAFHARGDYSCIRCGELIQGDKIREGCPACGYNGQRDPQPEKLYNVWEHMGGRSQEREKQLELVLHELADLMDDVRTGDYKPDSFTTQPARCLLRGVDIYADATPQDKFHIQVNDIEVINTDGIPTNTKILFDGREVQNVEKIEITIDTERCRILLKLDPIIPMFKKVE